MGPPTPSACANGRAERNIRPVTIVTTTPRACAAATASRTRGRRTKSPPTSVPSRSSATRPMRVVESIEYRGSSAAPGIPRRLAEPAKRAATALECRLDLEHHDVPSRGQQRLRGRCRSEAADHDLMQRDRRHARDPYGRRNRSIVEDDVRIIAERYLGTATETAAAPVEDDGDGLRPDFNRRPGADRVSAFEGDDLGRDT